jgi:ABC-type sugar transport system substrate-binding protein
VLALRQLQRAGRYDFVGVDRNPVIVEAVRNGEMLATLVQDSEKMAALAVEMADAAIKAPASTGRNILLPPFVMDREVLRNAR